MLCDVDSWPIVEKFLTERPNEKEKVMPRREHGPVLLVEDDRHIRELEAEALRDWGCEVIVAADAEEALDRLQDRSIALLVTDIRLTGELDGIGLARRLKQRLPDLKILIVGMDVDQLQDSSRSAVANAVLKKPFRLSDLEKRIAQLIGS